jgi:hypothetical protein
LRQDAHGAACEYTKGCRGRRIQLSASVASYTPLERPFRPSAKTSSQNLSIADWADGTNGSGRPSLLRSHRSKRLAHVNTWGHFRPRLMDVSPALKLNSLDRPRRRVLLLFAIVAITSCGDLGFVAGVTGRRSFNPPPIYREWWSATEACSGRQAPFERVVWYVANSLSGDGLVARGRWSSPHEIIIVAGYENDQKTVRHEMLHDLLNGDRSHRGHEWDRCGLRFEGT